MEENKDRQQEVIQHQVRFPVSKTNHRLPPNQKDQQALPEWQRLSQLEFQVDDSKANQGSLSTRSIALTLGIMHQGQTNAAVSSVERYTNQSGFEDGGSDSLYPRTPTGVFPKLRRSAHWPLQEPQVLLIASDRRLRLRMKGILTNAGYRISFVSSGREALRLLGQGNPYQLVLVCDVEDMYSVNICRQIYTTRDLAPSASMIVLSHDFEAENAIECLTHGASDFISGPHFDDDRVLLARLHVALRGYYLNDKQQVSDSAEPLKVGLLTINPVTFRVTICDDQQVQLTPLQFRILYRLARRPGRVFLHDELRQIAAEFGGDPDETTMKSHMSNLRKRLGEASSMIKTVRGFGYCLEEK